MITRRSLGFLGLAVGATGLLAALRNKDVSVASEAGDFEVTRTPGEWRKLLTPEQYTVLREHGTERAFSSPLDKLYEAGIYHCAACDLPLFTSDTKYDSKTGWPSFWQPIANAIGTRVDRSWFMVRTEVHCRRCGSHIGHVFKDGPQPTGLRYCMNGVALRFVPRAPT